jgi:hypothetical protein
MKVGLISSLTLFLLTITLSSYSQNKEKTAKSSPRNKTGVKYNFSLSNAFLKTLTPAVVVETNRMNFHEVEFNHVSYSKKEDSGLTITNTRANIRYQFAVHLTKNKKFIPQIGLTLQLGGSSNLTINPDPKPTPTNFARIRQYMWVIKPGLSFPCRFEISKRLFVDTNMIVNFFFVDGSWLTYHRPGGNKDVYGGWRKFPSFSADRFHMKFGLGLKF